MGAVKHVDFKFKHKGRYKDLPHKDDFGYVQLAKHKNKGAKKILLVLDRMPSEDLKNGKMLSGATGELLQSMVKTSKSFYGVGTTLNDYDWLAVSYSVFRTVNASEEFQDGAEIEFKRRLEHIITTYKPDTVVTFGPKPFKALNAAKIEWAKGNVHNFYGTPISTKVKFKGEKHKFQHFPTLSLNTLVTDQGKGSEMALAGYVTRNLGNALHGTLMYGIPSKPKYETVYVDSMKKFDSMMKKMYKAKVVAIDTETENLNRIKNKMLTIQFAADTKKAYVVPIYHKDTPFKGKELIRINAKLARYFETNENKQHVFANAVFDLNVIRNNTGAKFFAADIWDLFAGEYGLDENMKNLSGVTGGYYYSLGNLTMQYGSSVYLDIAFGKEMRKTIVNADMDEFLIEYCALDVIMPLYIRKQQMRRGEAIGHEKYQSLVAEQISDMLHSFSVFEHNGVRTDIDYLFYLKSKESPIRQVLDDITKELYQSKAVQKCNKLLAKQKGMPSIGLFGAANAEIFDIGKQDHLAMLMFDVLKLKPLSKGKSGKPKVDKQFQKEYEAIPEVALYTKIQGAKKLYSAYVKAFIKQWGRDADMRHDSRIRPHFQFIDVVTGRTSAKKPSLHQIPSRSELGKHIKRLFITEAGRIVIKVDFSAHEVRCWSLISGDAEIAKVFDVGRDLRERFKLAPSPELAERVSLEGDVHKINAAYFFKIPIKEVVKAIRNSVKQVIFGLIYQQGDKGLAESTGNTVAEIKELTAKFLKRFPVGVGWFDTVKAFGKKNYYVESPIGRRRYLWGHMVPKDARNADSVRARNERQSVNSPVQGMGSDFLCTGTREIERLKYKYFQDTGRHPDFNICNSVHDSLEIDCAHDDFWVAIRLTEIGLTDAVAARVKERHGMIFTVPLEIDFEIGPTGRHVQEWDYDYNSLEAIIKGTLKFQKKFLGHKINVDKAYKSIMEKQYDEMPLWMQKQVWNKKIKLPGMTKDPRSNIEKIKSKNRKADKIVLTDTIAA